MLHQVQAVGVVVTTISVELWSLSWLFEWACVGPKSPLPGSWIDHQGSCCCILGEARAQARMIEMKGRKISQDRGGYCWCLIPQWYECMLMHIGIPSFWCSIRCLFIRVRLWVVVVATLPWLEFTWYLGDKQMIWVWCKVPMNTALLALETRVDAFLWFGSVYETVYLYMNTYKTCWSMDAYYISELL